MHFYLRSGFTIVGYNSQFYDRPDPTRRTALYVARDVDLGEGSLTPE